MGLRKWAIAALVVLLALGAAAPATAWRVSKIGISAGDFFFGDEAVLQRPSATLFHSQDLATTDTEALAIAFPFASADGVSEPTIAQTSADTAAATDTGFFKANWCYTTLAMSNPGAYALTPDIGTWHPMKSPEMIGSGVSWPYMNNAPLYGENTITFRPSVSMAPDVGGVSLAPVAGTTSVKNALSGMLSNNTTSGLIGSNTSAGTGNLTAPANNATAAKIPQPNRDYKNMTKADIANTTGLDRMYRNANLVNTIPLAYKGTVDRPTQIDPLAKPMDILKPANKPQVISDARNITQDGTNLKTLLWDL